ncbi:hypothetical protein WMF45_34450 [Sorangium sp. So ce448]|uniref:hypothetical protein n=1 Tax=Sorangium sp. So ce448 TaxID=3133314 RepID=UPI003F608737
MRDHPHPGQRRGHGASGFGLGSIVRNGERDPVRSWSDRGELAERMQRPMFTGIATIEPTPYLHTCWHTHFYVEKIGTHVDAHSMVAGEIERTREGGHGIVSRARIIVAAIHG